MSKDRTSWEKVHDWYDQIVGAKGHFYHQNVVLPSLLKLLDFKKISDESLLDLACGQGVLARNLPKGVGYCGIDLASGLIRAAKEHAVSKEHQFFHGDITLPLPIKKCDFSHAAIVLALQNIENPLAALKNCAKHMRIGGRLCIVLNHPCYRIPRQSFWGIDEAQKLQYRRINRYMTPLKIPIQMNPGQRAQAIDTLSFHHPLSDYAKWLRESGFLIETIEEWVSPKVSEGKAAKMENRAREEFPLFLCFSAIRFAE